MKAQGQIVIGATFTFAVFLTTHARADYTTGFESPTYTAGPLDGQAGWIATQQAFAFGSGLQFTSAPNVVVSNTNPATGGQAIRTSLTTYDNQGGGYQVSGFLASRAVPTTTDATRVTFDLRVNNQGSQSPFIVYKAVFLTDADGYVVAGIDYQQSANQQDNSVGFYSSYDSGGAAYPARPTPSPHFLTYNTSPDAVLTPNTYQNWGIGLEPATNTLRYYLNGAQVFSVPAFRGTSISGFHLVVGSQDPLAYNEFQSGETVDLDNLVVGPPIIDSAWTRTGSGSFLDPASWSAGVPNGTGSAARFLGAITADATVSLNAPATVGTMTFDHAHKYTVAGSSTLTVQASTSAAITVVNGVHEIAAPLSLASNTLVTVTHAQDTLTISNMASTTADLTSAGAGVLRVNRVRASELSIAGGSLKLIPNGADAATSVVTSLAIVPGASLDLANNKLIVNYGAPGSPLAAIRSMIVDGRLISAGHAANTAIGFAEASALGLATFGGEDVDGSSVLVRLTVAGDSDLSGGVNFDDLLKLAQHYGSTSGQSWSHGDSNYDGAVNFDDLLALAQNYNVNLITNVPGITADFAADWSLARALVPEPAVPGILLAAASGCVSHRARRISPSSRARDAASPRP